MAKTKTKTPDPNQMKKEMNLTHSESTKTDHLIDLFASIKVIKDCDFGPDDKQIFFSSNLGEYFELWTIPVTGGFPRLAASIPESDVTGIKFSPDRKSLAFCVDKDGQEDFNVYVMNSSGGACKNVTKDIKLSMADYVWSPDGRSMAFLAEIDNRFQILVKDLEEETLTQLTDDDKMKSGLDWSSDGKWISFTLLKGSLSSDVCILNVETKEIRNLTEEVGGENSGAKFSPDAEVISFTSNATGNNKILFVRIENGETFMPFGKERDETFLRWNHKGNRFAYVVNENSSLSLYETDYPTLNTRRLTPEGIFASSIRYSANDSLHLYRMCTSRSPFDIFVTDGERLRQLTDCRSYGLPEEKLAMAEKIFYESFDGLKIPALFYRPKTEGKFPVLIWLHGGPTGQHFDRWDSFVQLFVSSGIGVLAPNVRGSTGYGSKFENMVFHDWGGGDLQDVIHAVYHLKKDPDVDQDRIMVGGGSYGGYMTLMATSKYPDLWKCGIDALGPVNLETIYSVSSPWVKPILSGKYGFKPPEEDPDYYHDRSPIYFVENVKCPLLLLYGENDARVSIEELTQLKEKLTQSGKTFEAESFGSEGHTMNRKATKIAHYGRMLKFILKYGKEGSA